MTTEKITEEEASALASLGLAAPETETSKDVQEVQTTKGKGDSRVTMYTRAKDARGKHLESLSALVSTTLTLLLKLNGAVSEPSDQTVWKTCYGNLLKANKELAKVELLLELE